MKGFKRWTRFSRGLSTTSSPDASRRVPRLPSNLRRLDGDGARRVGGRSNSPGQPVVYMAQSVALAVLENLVHMSRQDYPTGYVVVTATIPDHVLILDHARFLSKVPEENR